MDRLGVEGRWDISENVLAIVECNNCFSDGVQIATGCTFGNNCLVYFDIGKNAVILVKRENWEGVRVYVDAEEVRKYFDSEAVKLFEKVVVRREGSKEDEERFRVVWENVGWKMLEIPEDVFKIECVEVKPIEKSPIVESVRCPSCGELVMKTKLKDGVCLRCYGEFYAVIGGGVVRWKL